MPPHRIAVSTRMQARDRQRLPATVVGKDLAQLVPVDGEAGSVEAVAEVAAVVVVDLAAAAVVTGESGLWMM